MNMRIGILGLVAALLPAAAVGQAPAGANPFDGDWTTTVSCPDSSGALGYSFAVPTQIAGGVLRGERLRTGEVGRFELDGPVQPDGQARLYAKGSVGASQFAVGQRPKGTDYGYHVTARFQGAHGTGQRVEGRHCDLDFVRR
jgi:hypothetical protein